MDITPYLDAIDWRAAEPAPCAGVPDVRDVPLSVQGIWYGATCDRCDQPALIAVEWPPCVYCGGAECGDSGGTDYYCTEHWPAEQRALADHPELAYTVRPLDHRPSQ
jgi:hypothetical protein